MTKVVVVILVNSPGSTTEHDGSGRTRYEDCRWANAMNTQCEPPRTTQHTVQVSLTTIRLFVDISDTFITLKLKQGSFYTSWSYMVFSVHFSPWNGHSVYNILWTLRIVLKKKKVKFLKQEQDKKVNCGQSRRSASQPRLPLTALGLQAAHWQREARKAWETRQCSVFEAMVCTWT